MHFPSLRFGFTKCTLLAVILIGLLSVHPTQAESGVTPQVWSIVPDTSVSFPSDARFLVTFGSEVTGVDKSDFTTAGDDATAHVQSVDVTEDPRVYIVKVSRQRPSTELMLVLRDDDSIVGLDEIPLGGFGPQNGNTISTAHHDVSTNTTAHASIPDARSGGINVGQFSSIKLTETDLPVVAYYDATNGDLKLSICLNTSCTEKNTLLIDSGGDVGKYVSLALTTNDIPVMSYYDVTNGDLKIAICNNATSCSSPTIKQIDTTGDVGAYTSLALTSTNVPIISYYDVTNSDLKIAFCANSTNCYSSALLPPTIKSIDTTGDVGKNSSLALNSAGIPVISYHDTTNYDLKLAICKNSTNCFSSVFLPPTIIQVDTTLDRLEGPTSLVLSAADKPIIGYYAPLCLALGCPGTSGVKIAFCDTANTCGAPSITEVTAYSASTYTRLALTHSGTPVVASTYVDGEDIPVLVVATCNSESRCNAPTFVNIHGATMDVDYLSLALDSTDRFVISTFDQINQNLSMIQAPTVIDAGQPNAFSKATPINGATLNTLSVSLNWNGAYNTTSYEYCVSMYATSCTDWTSTGSATTISLSGLRYGTYYWQVRAVNGAGNTEANASIPWRFTIPNPPAVFSKTAPTNAANNQSLTPTLSWAASAYATSYEYCIATSAAACTTWWSTSMARTASLTGLSRNTTYYWNVRAKNAGGTTLSSATPWRFTTRP